MLETIETMRPEVIKQYWNLIFKKELFNEDETARIVAQAKVKEEFNNPVALEKYNLKNFEYTANDQLRSADDLINLIQRKQRELPYHNFGISISSAIFNYDENNLNEKGNVKAPSINTFKEINTLVFDIDAHIKGSKERFFLFTLDKKYQEMIIIFSYLKISEILKKVNYNIPVPTFTMVSGGGVQIAFDLSRTLLNKEEAQIVFNRLKTLLGKVTFDVLVKDMLGNFTTVSMEIDPTFGDISHTQRLAGLINQKYSYIPEFISIYEQGIFNFSDEEELKETLKTLIKSIDEDILENSNYTDAEKYKFEQYYATLIKEFMNARNVLINENISSKTINVDQVKEDAKIVAIQNKTTINPNDYNAAEYEVIMELKNKIQNREISLNTLFPEIEFHSCGSYYKILCPFHEERVPSMAVYENSLIFRDFHDDTNYNIILFYEKYYDVNKTTAIAQIANKANIKIKKSSKKDFEKLEVEELVHTLLEKIDTENYVYYRLANKNRSCVVRYIPTGESYVFDGPKMLAHHVLQNQLNIEDADKMVLEEFQMKFESKILIDAFEEFHPGKPTVFQKNFIKFVNLWVPSENYKKAVELSNSESIPKLELFDAIKKIEQECPWTFKYILQITQKGNLEWFINWLANTSHFKVMPTIPVVFGSQGVGKNLFVSTIIEWYHNNEYTKVVNSDRVMTNFNSILETASMIILDESDINSADSYNKIKFLSGNSKMAIEKKGVDVQMKDRFFNIMLFSNGDRPITHDHGDRRLQYFPTEKTLLQSCQEWGVSIEEFIENIKPELELFWAILRNIKTNKKWDISNEKDKPFIVQIFKQHSFGELILKLLYGQWQDIALQLSENISDPTIMKTNLELLQEIKNQFETSNKISLTLINRYLNSLNFKYKTSVQKFIQKNHLTELGINIEVGEEEVFIVIDKKKLIALNDIVNTLEVYNKLEKEENKDLSEEDLIKDLTSSSEKNDISGISPSFEEEKIMDNVVASQAPDIEAPDIDIPIPPAPESKVPESKAPDIDIPIPPAPDLAPPSI